MTKKWLPIFVALLAASAALAQAPPSAPPGGAPGRGGAGGPRVVSPEVHSDRTITFRLNAPNANEVILRFDEGDVKTFPLVKGADGVWSVTIPPTDPEVYVYSFQMDGMRVLDPANTYLKSGTSLDGNVVEVPGSPPRFDEVRDVPHGSVNMHTYMSTAAKLMRGLWVYVPLNIMQSLRAAFRCSISGTAVAVMKAIGPGMAAPPSS